MESLIVHIFHRSYFDNTEKLLIFTAVHNGLNLSVDEA